MGERGKVPLFLAHHRGSLSYSKLGNEDVRLHSCTASSPSEETGGLALQGFRFSSCAGGRNQSETWEGCIVSCTTANRCSRNWSKSTCACSVELKAATVLAASYVLR